MKATFPGYYEPTDEEFKQYWATCIFVLDANVLLNLYRYSPETSKELLNILQSISDRLWLPYQFASEYHKHLLEIKSTPSKEYDNATKSLVSTKESLLKEIRTLKNRTRLEIDDWLDRITTAIEGITSEIEHRKQAHINWLNGDNISETIAALLYNEGKKRYEREQPPGYGDKKEKPEPECYGDLVAWFQIIDHAKSETKSIILITEDVKKGDWHLNISGKTIGPRPELVQEMRQEADTGFYIYPTDQFMKYARQYIDSQVTDKAISEVREVRKDDEQEVAKLQILHNRRNADLNALDETAQIAFETQARFQAARLDPELERRSLKLRRLPLKMSGGFVKLHRLPLKMSGDSVKPSDLIQSLSDGLVKLPRLPLKMSGDSVKLDTRVINRISQMRTMKAKRLLPKNQ
jgi:predicted nucleic acid-binding protein